MNADADVRLRSEWDEGAPIPLAADEVHLWLAFYGQIGDDRLHSAYRGLLSSQEREQEPRFYFADDRRRYLVTRALVRTVLSRYVPVHPAEWSFRANAYGRPEIINPQAENLTFNISHTRSLIVLGVTRGRALGVDVESYRRREVAPGIAEHYFAPREVTALAAVPREQQQYRFFEYWTFKESYIKARGMGLSLPLDKFAFHYPHERSVEIAIDRELADDASRWHFWQFRAAPDYLLAVCAERLGSRSPLTTIRHVVPLQHEQLLPLELLRVSQFDEEENAR